MGNVPRASGARMFFITVCWLVPVYALGMAVYGWVTGNAAIFIVFTVIAALVIYNFFPRKLYRRFTAWVARIWRH